jgi:hypothetical protein
MTDLSAFSSSILAAAGVQNASAQNNSIQNNPDQNNSIQANPPPNNWPIRLDNPLATGNRASPPHVLSKHRTPELKAFFKGLFLRARLSFNKARED